MPTTTIIQQHTKQHRLPVFRPAEAFCRWYERPLQKHEYEIITALETVRQCSAANYRSSLSKVPANGHSAPRVLVIDPPGKSSVALLTSYLCFLDAIAPDQEQRTLIVDSKRDTLKQIAEWGYPNARLLTTRQAQRYRGGTYHRLLMLNIDRYCTFSPFHDHPVKWTQLYRTLLGPISIDNDSIVILHMTMPKSLSGQTRRLNHLKRLLPGVFNIQPDILERTQAFVDRILEHNRTLNAPVAIPLDDWPPDNGARGLFPRAYESPPDKLSIMHSELCID